MEIPITTRIKLSVAFILTLLLITFIALNSESIEVNLIFAKIEIRRSFMMIAAFVIGIFTGWVSKSFFTFKVKKKEEE